MRFLSLIEIIWNPGFWSLNYPYCPKWDGLLNNLMDNHRFEKIPSHPWMPISGVYALGDYHIWAECYPCGYGRNCHIFKKTDQKYVTDTNNVEMHAPSRKTMIRMKKKLERDLINPFAISPK